MNETAREKTDRPEILAPAGDEQCFLAALAAGADAIYLGLKHFSARMQASNFGLAELSRLTGLAHQNGVRVYVAMNTLVKPGELGAVYRLIWRLQRQVEADGLIVQDLAMPDLARQAGFRGGIFFSTLANICSPSGLAVARSLGASRVILPRELSVDEMRLMGQACPQGLSLEAFVHGALCYCVSGRCYWSSYMGGKSGLRGRCVQPCRRLYSAAGEGRGRERGKDRGARHFSTLDLSLDVLAKILPEIPNLAAWKIEGRKKGPHYVYHAVTAYRMLRDSPNDPKNRREACAILQAALGRPSTRARFLPQKDCRPVDPAGYTSSGLLAGKISPREDGATAFRAHLELLPGDLLRVGVEDERWHATLPVTRRVPRGGSLVLKLPRHQTPPAGTPVFLIDRREPGLRSLLAEWRKKAQAIAEKPVRPVNSSPRLPGPRPPRALPDIALSPRLPRGRQQGRRGLMPGLWLSPACESLSRTLYGRISWWLPPAIWPDEEDRLRQLISRMVLGGARHFVLNAPWQTDLMPDATREKLQLIAGPFCNAANACALGALAGLGFAAAFVSPELSGEDYLKLPAASPLPLGLVISGFWPVGISRYELCGLRQNQLFASPREEKFWARSYGQNLWIYPAWPLNLEEKRDILRQAGYSFFASMAENPPRELAGLEARPGLFNWESGLI